MAPAVPFALLGVVQLAAVAVWLGLAGAVCFPRLRRRTTPVLVVGALVMAVADALTALRLSTAQSNPLGELRLAGLALVAIGFAAGWLRPRSTALPAIVAPLGVRPSIAVAGGVAGVLAAGAAWWRGAGEGMQRRIAGSVALAMVLTAVATVLAAPARTSTDAALAVLAARAAASAALIVGLVDLARGNLLGKLVGTIVAGVVAMALGAVAVVGVGVAGEVQHEQSQRLLKVARAQQVSLQSLATRAGVYAHVVALCPTSRSRCIAALKLFSVDPDYFALIATGSGTKTIAPGRHALDSTALVQLAGSAVVHGALAPSASSQLVASGPLLLHGSPPRLSVVAAVPGRPGGVTNAQVKPTFAAVYGIRLNDAYLRTVAQQAGYDVSVVSGNHVIASSLGAKARTQVQTDARRGRVGAAEPATTSVVAAQGTSPTVAFVPVTQVGNDDVRIATLAISQPASAALAAQRSVLRRLVLTALVVLLVVALAAFAMAQRVVDPVRRLTRAAGRVRRGDLDATVPVESTDEVGSLARAFDDMTASLRGLTGDLRDAAASEAALRGRLEAVVGSMTDGLVTSDGDGNVAGANPMALQMLGCLEADILHRPLAEVVDVRDVEGEPVLRDGVPAVTADAVLCRVDGSTLPVRASVAPLLDEVGHLVVLSDRSREREIERLKTEFLSSVSHELRTPLTPIRGYAEMLARRPNLPREQIQSFVAEILGGTARMNRAVDLLVDVAALEAGRVAPVRTPLRVKAFADERLTQWRSRYPDRARDLGRRVAASLPRLDADPLWLSKALDELVDNAVKHTPRGSTITLAAALGDDGRVRLSVRDTGPGIDTERLGELLGDFSQADASDTRRVGGFGLGLGFVSRVAAQLDLRLRVSSVAGRGAEFSLDVPVTDLPAPSRRASTRRRAPRAPKRAAKSTKARR